MVVQVRGEPPPSLRLPTSVFLPPDFRLPSSPPTSLPPVAETTTPKASWHFARIRVYIPKTKLGQKGAHKHDR